jgi:hypothetical protein
MNYESGTNLHGSRAIASCVAAPPSDPDYTRVVTAPPRPWKGARLGKCLANVLEMIRRQGGEAVFGWALERGPLRQVGWYPPPLYCRWLHHVVWRDAAGALWEVSPHLQFDGADNICFLPTEFYADPSAEFLAEAGHDWASLPCRYLALRPEGEEVARQLNLGQEANPATRRPMPRPK